MIKNLAKEPGELMLLDNLAKEEIEVALKEGKDLVKLAGEKVERRRELERKKRIEDASKRFFWRKNVGSKEYWLSPNEMREKVMAWAKDYRGKLQTKGQLHRFNKASIASYRNEKGEIEIVFGMNGGVLETGKKFNTISAEKNLPLLDELSNRLPDKTDWPNKANCAECDAVNQAIHNGAKWEDIQIHTINIDKNGNMSDFYRCDECLGIFNDMYVTSE